MADWLEFFMTIKLRNGRTEIRNMLLRYFFVIFYTVTLCQNNMFTFSLMDLH